MKRQIPICNLARQSAASFVLVLLLFGLKAGRGEIVTLGPGGGGAQLCAALHPTRPDVLLLGQDVGGILKSENGGETWRHVNRGLAAPQLSSDVFGVQELMFSTANPDIVFAATWGGLFRSVDGAESWTRVLPSGTNAIPDFTPVSTVAISLEGDLVLAGTGDPFDQKEGGGLYRSTDGGATFVQIQASGIPNTATFGGLVLDPNFSGPDWQVYAATSAGLYHSRNAGLSFSKIQGGFPHENIRDVAVGSAGQERVFWIALQSTETGAGGIFRSTDGKAWSAATGNLPLLIDTFYLVPHALLAHPQHPFTAYVALRHGFEFSGLFRTDNGGVSWTQLTPDEVVLGWNESWGVWTYGGALSPANPDRILLTNEAQPLLSDNAGQTWRQVGTSATIGGAWSTRGVEVTFTYTVKTAPGHTKRLYAGYEDIGLWRTDDAGASWSPIFLQAPGQGAADACTELHVHPSSGDEFYAVSGSWSNGLREPDSPSDLILSNDGGRTLKNLTVNLLPENGYRGCAAVDFSTTTTNRTLLFARHGQTIFRSTDGGARWSPSDSGMSEEHRALLFVLTLDPAEPRHAYAGTHTEFGAYGSSGGIYRSGDGGATWQPVTGHTSTDIHFLGFRGSPKRLFAAGARFEPASGLMKGALEASDDDGLSFQPVLPQPFVMDVVEMPGHPSTLLAAAGAHYAPGPRGSLRHFTIVSRF